SEQRETAFQQPPPGGDGDRDHKARIGSTSAASSSRLFFVAPLCYRMRAVAARALHRSGHLYWPSRWTFAPPSTSAEVGSSGSESTATTAARRPSRTAPQRWWRWLAGAWQPARGGCT